MKKYLVTGATGFVGSWVTRELIKRGEDVSILVRDKKLNWRLHDIADQISIFQSDLQDPGLGEIIDTIKPTVIFHIAAAGATSTQQSSFYSFLDINVKGLANILSAAKRNNIDLFVNTGSSSEYGIKDLPMNESDLLAPINDYGVSKAAATLYAQSIAVTKNMPIITLRLFSPFGYFDDEKRLISYVIRQALKGEPISLSTRDNVRDFVYVEDVVGAYMVTEQAKIKPGEIINIGSGKQHSVYDIVRLILDITKSRSEVLWGTMPKQARQIEPNVWQADINKAKKLLQWEPQFSLYEGLEKTISYYKKLI